MTLLLLALVIGPIILAEAILARYEVMVYAAGWRNPASPLPEDIPYARGAPADRPPSSYVIYLDGIGKRRLTDTRDGGRLVRAIIDAAPEMRVLGQIQPYSPLAMPLAGRRIWDWLRRHAGIVLFLHNVMQTFVAADRRYRPLYNRAVGQQIAEQLRGAGYVAGNGVPVVLLSYSGGAQVATGAVSELFAQLKAPLILINIGGFHNGANDLSAAEHVHDLTSRFDRISGVGRWMFPPRWPVVRMSPWNRAIKAGLVNVHQLEPATHVGPRSYISATAKLPDGRTHLERTTDVVVSLIRARVAPPAR
ncbi:hypothetical protein [Microbacterium yannicii]|uniref:hypothetical protein n=1 Tax=Microbacterium yannicii TaxID=671622 RepID=UPI00036B4C63|nr:hypothetical protein [Microbacterium yannicii]